MKKLNKKNFVIWRQNKKVILRPVEESDIPLFTKWINDPLNSNYISVGQPMNRKVQKG